MHDMSSFRYQLMNILFGRVRAKRYGANAIVHGCVQKTATRWFVRFFSHPLIRKRLPFVHHDPHTNFIPRTPQVLERLKVIPSYRTISPFYADYEEFRALRERIGPVRAFFIVRDPRDLFVSDYFSTRYTHPVIDPWFTRVRADMDGMSDEDGMLYRIPGFHEAYSRALRGWTQADAEDPALCLLRFEDAFGAEQKETIEKLVEHLRLDISREQLSTVLEHLSFKNLTGRNPGEENTNSHYRAGKVGNWREHFTPAIRTKFKECTQSLTEFLGYEDSSGWA